MSNYSDSAFYEKDANTSWYKAFHLVPEKSTVLDVGCSSGNFGAELTARKHCVVDGIEIDPSDSKKARAKLRKVYQLDIERDDLSDLTDTYDIVYFGDVIEHLVDPSAALKKIVTLLKPGGKILFSIPNMAHVAIRLLLLKGNFEYTETGLLDKTHLHYYSLDEVYRVFQEAGFNIDHIDFVEQDYPKVVIEDWLNELGLTGNKHFYDTMKQPEAAAFQFVGTATVSKNAKPLKRKQFGPISLVDDHYTKKVNDQNAKNGELVAELKKVQKLYHQLNKDHVKLLEQWTTLKKNPLAYAARVAKRRLKTK